MDVAPWRNGGCQRIGEGRFNRDGRGRKDFTSNGSQLLSDIIMAQSDQAPHHAVEGMIEGIWVGAPIADLWEACWGKSISEIQTITPFLSREIGAFKKAWASREPSPSVTTTGQTVLKGGPIGVRR